MEKKIVIKLEQISETFGDCTALYAVTFTKTYTVREFLQEILTKKEWGSIEVFGEDDEPSLCKYKQDKLISNLPDDLLDKMIVEASARGGWSCMDYKLLTL